MRLATELSRLALAASLPVALFVSFPYGAIGFSSNRELPRESAPSCALVELSPAEENRAIAAARTSWTADASELRRTRLDLLDMDFVGAGAEELERFRPARIEPETAGYDPLLLPPSAAAGEPVQLQQDHAEPRKPAFTREELLKLPY